MGGDELFAPDLLIEADVRDEIACLIGKENITDRAISLMLHLSRRQMFNNRNKRMAPQKSGLRLNDGFRRNKTTVAGAARPMKKTPSGVFWFTLPCGEGGVPKEFVSGVYHKEKFQASKAPTTAQKPIGNQALPPRRSRRRSRPGAYNGARR
jgi:hypothetical protein